MFLLQTYSSPAGNIGLTACDNEGMRFVTRQPMRIARAAVCVIIAWNIPTYFGGNATHVAGDGIGYSLYVRSLVIHGKFSLFHADLTPTENAPESTTMQTIQLKQIKFQGGKVVNQYPVGPSLVWLPGYSVVHLLLKLSHSIGIRDLPPADGFSTPYRYSIGLTTIALALLALLMALSILASLSSTLTGIVALIAVYYGTPAYHYTVYDSSMSEIPTMFAVTLVYWVWWKIRSTQSTVNLWSFWGAALGLAIIMRYQHVFLLVLPLVELYLSRKAAPISKRIIDLSLGLVPLITIQIVVWRLTSGSWTPPEYATGIETWKSFNPTMLLLSSRKGLIASHPLWLFAILGLVVSGVVSRERVFLCGLAGYVFFLVWLNQLPLDFWAGFGYGSRRFVPATLACMVGIAAVIEAIMWAVRRQPLIAAILFLAPFVWLSSKSRMDIQNNPEVASHGIPQMPKLISQLEKSYRRSGWPFSWPANQLWARRYGTTPDRFDYGAAVFADIPTDVGDAYPGGHLVSATHPFFDKIVREHPVIRVVDGVLISHPTTIWLNLARLPRPYAIRLNVAQPSCCKSISVVCQAQGRKSFSESFSSSSGKIGLIRDIAWRKGTNPVTIAPSSPVILKSIELVEEGRSN